MVDEHSTLVSKLENAIFVCLLVLAFGFAFDWQQPLLKLANISVGFVEVLLFLVAGSWLLVCLRGSFPIDRRFRSENISLPRLRAPLDLWLPIGIWVGLLLLSALAAPHHQWAALKFSLKVFATVLVGGAAFELSHSYTRWQLVAKALALGGSAVGLLSVSEALGFTPIVAWLEGFHTEPTTFSDIQRISATLIHPNILAMVLELTLPLMLAWVLTAQRPWKRMFLGGGLLVGQMSLMLTLSRGGLIAYFISFGVITVIAAYHHQKTILYGSLMSIGIQLVMVWLALTLEPRLIVRMISEGSNELWYRAVYQVPPRLKIQPQETLTVPITLTNTGLQVWDVNGPKPINLAYHLVWVDTSKADIYALYNGPRTPLPTTVSPNATVTIQVQLTAPVEPGEYIIEWDLIQESVTWFSRKGASPGRTYLLVEGSPSGLASVPDSIPLQDDPTQIRGRLELWQVAVRMACARPFLGVGPYNYHWNYNLYADTERKVLHAHSLYFEWLADTGVLGLGAFLWASWQLAKRIWIGQQQNQTQQGGIGIWRLAVSGSLVAWYVHGVFDFVYVVTSAYVAFGLVAGLAVRVTEIGNPANALE